MSMHLFLLFSIIFFPWNALSIQLPTDFASNRSENFADKTSPNLVKAKTIGKQQLASELPSPSTTGKNDTGNDAVFAQISVDVLELEEQIDRIAAMLGFQFGTPSATFNWDNFKRECIELFAATDDVLIAEMAEKKLRQSVLKFVHNSAIQINGSDDFETIGKLLQSLRIFRIYKLNESEIVGKTNRLFDRILKLLLSSKNAAIFKMFESVGKESHPTESGNNSTSTIAVESNLFERLQSNFSGTDSKHFDQVLKSDSSRISFKRLAILHAFIVQQKIAQLAYFICENKNFGMRSAAMALLIDFARKLVGRNDGTSSIGGPGSKDSKTILSDVRETARVRSKRMAGSGADEQERGDEERRRTGRRRLIRRHRDDPWDRFSCRTLSVSLLFAMLAIAGQNFINSNTSGINAGVADSASSRMASVAHEDGGVVAQQFNQIAELSRRALSNQCPATMPQLRNVNKEGDSNGHNTNFEADKQHAPHSEQNPTNVASSSNVASSKQLAVVNDQKENNGNYEFCAVPDNQLAEEQQHFTGGPRRQLLQYESPNEALSGIGGFLSGNDELFMPKQQMQKIEDDVQARLAWWTKKNPKCVEHPDAFGCYCFRNPLIEPCDPQFYKQQQQQIVQQNERPSLKAVWRRMQNFREENISGLRVLMEFFVLALFLKMLQVVDGWNQILD